MTRPSEAFPTADEQLRVDEHFSRVLQGEDPALTAALAASEAAGMPPINVSANHAALLGLVARMIGARRILEVGTLGGYSTIQLARGLAEGGTVVTLEKRPEWADVARANLAAAGVGDRVEIRVGLALETLDGLISEGAEPFDLVFVDADKRSNPEYLDRAIRLGRPGTVIIIDNVVRGGTVLEADSDDEDVLGTRRVLELIGADPRLEATAIQTVGAKGWDGFALIRMR